jgi:hypothetical protein
MRNFCSRRTSLSVTWNWNDERKAPDEIIFPFFEAMPKLAKVKQAPNETASYGDRAAAN